MLAVPLPLGPVSPEFPVIDVGLAIPVELAGPVLPVLVLEDCEVTSPESPLMLSGDSSTSASPPAPPLADVLVMESPPLV